MAVALHGNLKDFGIAEVFQLIGQQRKTGALEISSDGAKVRLLFSDGAVVSAAPEGRQEHAALGDLLVRCGLLTREQLNDFQAESESSARPLPAVLVAASAVASDDLEAIGELLTKDTVFEVLGWKRGSFHFSAHPVVHDRPADKLLAAEQILMEGLRMIDEWQTFASQVPSGDAVFERVRGFASYRQLARGEARNHLAAAERVLQLVDGRLSARRVIDLSRLGVFDGTRTLAELRQAGAITLVEGARVGANVSAGRAADWPSRLRLALATLTPILFLVAVVSEIDRQSQLPRSTDGIVLRLDPLASARSGFEKRRVRNALEVHRYLHGDWPSDLAELAIDPEFGGAPLSPDALRSYYFARLDGAVLLLSPER